MKRYLSLLIFPLALAAASLEEGGVRRIRAHLLLDNPKFALEEAEMLFERFPQSPVVASALIEALAANGSEERALDEWRRLTTKDPNLLYDRHLLEELSWGVLKKGLASSQYGVRLAAMVGIYLTQDVRAVPCLLKMMRDPNAIIRSVAIQLAEGYRDAPLKREVARLLEEERVWMVRLQAIEAAGALRMKEVAPRLHQIVQSERATYEEIQAGIASLVQIYDAISLEEVEKLSKSNRAGLRHLACSLAAHFEVEGGEGVVARLLKDPHPDVRIAALNALSLVYRHRMERPLELLAAPLQDAHPAVAITASYGALLLDPKLGAEHFRRWLKDDLPEHRRLAAAALAASGERGALLALEEMPHLSDPYVKANLALGLLGQRKEVKLACDLLAEFLETEKRMWMWDKRPNPLFQVLSPSQVRYIDQIPNYPEAIDQMTRLSLVSELALVEDPRALPALKHFLQEKRWGITGVAAATLLQEGDETALDVVRELLNDPDPAIRLQACLVLAHFGKEESVMLHLQGAYGGADHEKKLHILEALGRVGRPESFSFLASVLSEPFPILRVAAAAALIQSVNR